MTRNVIMVCLLALGAAGRADETIDRDNVVILLDSSGSMADRMGNQIKIDAAKQATREVLGTVPQTTQVGLMVFGRGRHPDGWVFPLGPRNDELLLAELEQVQPAGGTPLGAYIKKAADRLLQQRDEQLGYGSYRLLVVTDGQAGDADKVARYAPEVVARGIGLDVIGVDMSEDHQLAALAHSYRTADDADSLRSALQEVLGEWGGAGSDAAADEEAFALLEGLPDGAAEVVLTAFGVGRNTPIGDDPAFDPHQFRPDPARPNAAPPPSGPSGGGGRGIPIASVFWLVVAVVIGLKIVKAMAR